MATYQVDTNDGHSYQIETEESNQPQQPQQSSWDKFKSAVAPAADAVKAAMSTVPSTPMSTVAQMGSTASEAIKKIPGAVTQGMESIAPGSSTGVQPQLKAIEYSPEIVGAMGGEAAASAAKGATEALAPKAAEEASTETPGLFQKLKGKVEEGIETLKGPSSKQAELLGKEMRQSYTPEANIEKAKLVGQDIVSPEEAKVTYAEQQLRSLPEDNANKLARLEELRKGAGSQMEAAEKEAGFNITPDAGFEQMAGSKEGMGKVLDVMGKWANMSPDELSKTVDPKTINLFRRLSKAGSENLSDFGQVTAQKGEKVAGDALGQLSDKFNEAKSQYRDIMQAIDDVKDTQPLQAKAMQRQIAYLKVGLDKAQQDAQNLVTAARSANAQQLRDINAQALDLLKQGIKRDALVGKIKLAAGAVGAGTAYKMFH